MNEPTQSDIFASMKKEKEAIKLAETKVALNKNVPLGYIPVTFTSGDKLCPAVLHFRNYSMDELLELSSASEETQFEVLINKVLNNCIHEDFDCAKLHIEHIKQIMLTIYKNFWGNTLYSRPYYKDLSINSDDDSNIAYVDINISDIKLKSLGSEFKNKFSITDKITNKKIAFILPTIEHLFIATKYVQALFSDEESKYKTIKATLLLIDRLRANNQNEQADQVMYDVELKKQYEIFEQEKSKAYLRALQAQLIYSVDGVVIETIEEKINLYKTTIDAVTWVRYQTIVKKHADFGIDDSYEFMVEDKKLVRRFSFRPMAFIPPMESQTDTGYTVCFDD